MKTYYLIRPKVFVNFVDNTGLNQKVLSMIVEDEESGMRFIIPFNEHSLPFFQQTVQKFDEWINKKKRPVFENVLKDKDEPRYIG